MNENITDKKINKVMERIKKAMIIDIDSDNLDERIGQLMILCIEEGYKERIIEIKNYTLDYSKLNKNDKFYCSKIIEILDSLKGKSKNVISRVLLNRLVKELESKSLNSQTEEGVVK